MELINLSVRLSNDCLPLCTQDIPIYCFAHNDTNIPMICQEVRKRFLDSKHIFIFVPFGFTGVSFVVLRCWP